MTPTAAAIPRTVAPLAVLLLATFACTIHEPRRDPVGEQMPVVQGSTLTGEPIVMPREIVAPAILLVAYADDAQLDLDRWIRGLLAETPDVAVRQLVTVPGFAGALQPEQIGAGQRDTEVDEGFAEVIAVQDGAEQLAEFTGDAADDLVRVLLVDADGVVRWFWDAGFTDRALLALGRAAEQVDSTASPGR